MGLIPQTKCGRCDRTYSGLRSRCPYCGAHRSKRGKRVSDGDNATWKLIIGVLLIVVLIAAVIVIIVTGNDEKTPTPSDDGSGGASIDDVHGKDPNTPPSESGDNGPKVTVTGADGTPITTLTLKVGGTADLTAVVTPETITDVPVWSSSDPAIVSIQDNGITGLSYRLTAVAKGTAIVTVTVGDLKQEITVTVEEDTTVSPIATSIQVRNQYGTVLNDITLKLGETLELTVEITPSTVTSTPQWTNSNEATVQLVAVDETNMKVRLTGMGDHGNATITCTVDGITFEILIRGSNTPFG